MKYLYYLVAALIFLALVNITSRWIGSEPNTGLEAITSTESGSTEAAAPEASAELPPNEPDSPQTVNTDAADAVGILADATNAAEEKVGEIADPAAALGEDTLLASAEEPSAAAADKEPSAAAVKEPSATSDKEPLAAADKEPSATSDKEPSAAAVKEPSATSDKEPSATSDKEPSATSDKEPSATSDKEPSATSDKEPSATSDKEPSAAAVKEPSAAADKEPSAPSTEEIIAATPDQTTPDSTTANSDTTTQPSSTESDASVAAPADLVTAADNASTTEGVDQTTAIDATSDDDSLLDVVADKTSEVAGVVARGTKETFNKVVTAAQNLVADDTSSDAQIDNGQTVNANVASAGAEAAATTAAEAEAEAEAELSVVAAEPSNTSSPIAETRKETEDSTALAVVAAAATQTSDLVTTSSGSGAGIAKPDQESIPAEPAKKIPAVAAPVDDSKNAPVVVTAGSQQKAKQTSPQKATTASIRAPAAVLKLIERHPGKVLMVNFWTADCASCKPAFAWLNEMRRKYWGKGLHVIGVNQGSAEQAEAFLADSPASFEIINDPDGELAAAFWLSQVPSTFVIAEDGSLVASHQGHSAVETGRYEDAIRRAINKTQ